MKLSAKLRGVTDGIAIWCAGCCEVHAIDTARWTWNADVERPVITPSVKITRLKCKIDCWGQWAGEWELDEHGKAIPDICHFFVGSNGIPPGEIGYLGDTTHHLSGKTLPLADFPW